jgi:DNA-binding MarR family transcriptional regulator
MTTQPAIYGQFGPALGFAERTLTEMLHEHLAQRDTRPATWYALQLMAIRGPRLSRETLTSELERSQNVDSDSVGELVERLEADGLIRGGAELEITTEGEALHRSLRDYVTALTARLLRQFDLHDVETTVRTLQAITARASRESSIAGHAGSNRGDHS